jgi:hypothetical protein
MTDFALIHDKKFAVIFVEDDGTEDGRWTILTGLAKWQDGHLFVHRGMDVPEFPIPDETLDRVKPVLPEVREVLGNADFCTMLRVGPLPADAAPAEITHTGLRLPRDGEDFDHVA